MKKAIFIILLLPLITFAQEKQQWIITLQNQSSAVQYHFDLPPLEEEYSNPHYALRYRQGLRLSIKPSFDDQVTYEFLYNDVSGIPNERKNDISKYIDVKNVLVRKYEASKSSKDIIDKYYTSERLFTKECFDKYPNFESSTIDEKIKINNECNEARKVAVPTPVKLDIIVTDLFVEGLHSKIKELQKRSLSLFNNFEPYSALDGTKYIIEVVLHPGYTYKYWIWSPHKNTEEEKLIEDILKLANSI